MPETPRTMTTVFGRDCDVRDSAAGLLDTIATSDNVEVALLNIATVESLLADIRARTVQEARAKGVTWERIGAPLGLTKQAAQQRYGGHASPAS